MKFQGSKIINKPREIVAKYFSDPQYLGEYQDGFIKKELLEGKQGGTGSISKMYYKYGNMDMILTETVVINNLPDYFEGFYHHKHMDNTMKCTFTAIDENTTIYEYEFEYTRMNWIMPRLMAILFPGMYRKQGEKWMQQFKEFVEKQEDHT
jgi:hypothetical protein